MKIVSSHQMRILEQCANQRGVADSAMMENAGVGMARCIRSMFRSITGFQFFVLVGPGNNGGDGLVLARLLRSWGYRVVVAILAKRPDDDPKRAFVDLPGGPRWRTSILRCRDPENRDARNPENPG